MKRILLTIMAVLMLLPACGKADRSRILDAALSMLEEGNPFLVRYNKQNSAGITARWPLGCPYLWGGRDAKMVLKTITASQSSEYYRKGRKYLYGLDCIGLIRWIETQAGYAAPASISVMLDRNSYGDRVNYKASKAAGEARTEVLDVGDLLAVRHQSGTYHCAVYIGTLWDFGYTYDTLPTALKPYMYYPLLLHCTGSGDYYERYRAELAGTDVLPPYGGAIVTLLDAGLSGADSRTPDVLDLGQACFDLEGYHLQVTDLSQERQVRWLHWREKP